MTRPFPRATSSGSATRPSRLKIDSGVSTISSNRSVPGGSRNLDSNSSQAAASADTCSGAVIFGSVTTKSGGSTPPVPSSSVERNSSKVRRPRRFVSPRFLMRMPMPGGSVPAFSAETACDAAVRAAASSSASERLPKPSSKSMR